MLRQDKTRQDKIFFSPKGVPLQRPVNTEGRALEHILQETIKKQILENKKPCKHDAHNTQHTPRTREKLPPRHTPPYPARGQSVPNVDMNTGSKNEFI